MTTMTANRTVREIERKQNRVRRYENVSLFFSLIKLIISTCIYSVNFAFLLYLFISVLDIGLIHNGDSANQLSWNFFRVFFHM
nr:hypothetical protein YSBCXYJI_YSBCXYJI_CDS_0051 [Caudoviricetes sp.]